MISYSGKNIDSKTILIYILNYLISMYMYNDRRLEEHIVKNITEQRQGKEQFIKKIV